MGAIMGKKATGCIKNLPTNYRCTHTKEKKEFLLQIKIKESIIKG